jgi:hypothetical protein
MKKESVDVIITGLKQARINFVSTLPDSDFTQRQDNLTRPPFVLPGYAHSRGFEP